MGIVLATTMPSARKTFGQRTDPRMPGPARVAPVKPRVERDVFTVPPILLASGGAFIVAAAVAFLFSGAPPRIAAGQVQITEIKSNGTQVKIVLPARGPEAKTARAPAGGGSTPGR
jgi:hypothetical protein